MASKLTISVEGSGGWSRVSFIIKTTTKMRHVFRAYASRNNLDPASLRFEVAGASAKGNVAVASNDTAHLLNLHDGDRLKCIWTCTGKTPAFLQIPGFHLYTGGVVPEELRPELTCVCIAPQVTCIPPGVFSGCAKLEYVHLNEGLHIIGERTFERCMALRSVTLPSTVIELGLGAFQGCSSLIELRLNEGLQVIGGNAFARCSALQSVPIPSTVRTIGVGSFARCLGLRSVTIPSTVTELGRDAFHLCSNLSEVILLGSERLLYQDILSSGVSSTEKTLLNQRELNRVLNFLFSRCPLSTVKIPIFGAVSESMSRLLPECRVLFEEGIRNLHRLELMQDGTFLACFPTVSIASNDETEDDPDNAFDVQDTNNQTASSLYQVLQLIAFHELRESSIMIELAMWKSSRIDYDRARADCRVPIPDPAKSLIMEYCGFAGFLTPAIEGAQIFVDCNG